MDDILESLGHLLGFGGSNTIPSLNQKIEKYIFVGVGIIFLIVVIVGIVLFNLGR